MQNSPEGAVIFASREELWSWLGTHATDHPAIWVRLANSRKAFPSVTFYDLLEAGIAFGWSESTRRAGDDESYLQRFGPRRTRGTTSERNRRIADELERTGRMTDAGREALGR